jgi:hypothetical protein
MSSSRERDVPVTYVNRKEGSYERPDPPPRPKATTAQREAFFRKLHELRERAGG